VHIDKLKAYLGKSPKKWTLPVREETESEDDGAIIAPVIESEGEYIRGVEARQSGQSPHLANLPNTQTASNLGGSKVAGDGIASRLDTVEVRWPCFPVVANNLGQSEVVRFASNSEVRKRPSEIAGFANDQGISEVVGVANGLGERQRHSTAVGFANNLGSSKVVRSGRVWSRLDKSEVRWPSVTPNATGSRVPKTSEFEDLSAKANEIWHSNFLTGNDLVEPSDLVSEDATSDGEFADDELVDEDTEVSKSTHLVDDRELSTKGNVLRPGLSEKFRNVNYPNVQDASQCPKNYGAMDILGNEGHMDSAGPSEFPTLSSNGSLLRNQSSDSHRLSSGANCEARGLSNSGDVENCAAECNQTKWVNWVSRW